MDAFGHVNNCVIVQYMEMGRIGYFQKTNYEGPNNKGIGMLACF